MSRRHLVSPNFVQETALTIAAISGVISPSWATANVTRNVIILPVDSTEGTALAVKPRIQDVAAINAKDTYADALNHVNLLLNKAFGVPTQSRKTIAHAPLLIQRTIVQDLREKWPEEFHRTSSHRFRHPHDLQYAFLYMNYIKNQRHIAPEKLLDNFIDVNRNGKVDETEMRSTIDKLKQVQRRKTRIFAPAADVSRNAREETMLRQCLNQDNRTAILAKMVDASCSNLIRSFATELLFEVNTAKDAVFFAMLTDKGVNATLKSAYNSTSLFLCFNDDIKEMKLEVCVGLAYTYVGKNETVTFPCRLMRCFGPSFELGGQLHHNLNHQLSM